MIGDFNLTKEHWPMGAALATGLLFDMDDVAGPHALQGTHRNHAGELTGRVIDFMLATNEFFPVSRDQHQSVADHDLILIRLSLERQCHSIFLACPSKPPP